MIAALEPLLAMMVSLCEAALLALFLDGRIGVTAYLGGHAATVVALGATLAARPGVGAKLHAALWSALVLFTGPIGALGLWTLGAAERRRMWIGKPPVRLDARIVEHEARLLAPESAIDRLYDDIRIGRRPRSAPGDLTDLDGALKSGSLALQQAALAKLSQAYHPRMRGALRRALRSPAAFVRAQAAAIHVGLHERARKEAASILALAEDTPTATLLSRIGRALGSGLLEPAEALRLQQTGTDAYLRDLEAGRGREADRETLTALLDAGDPGAARMAADHLSARDRRVPRARLSAGGEQARTIAPEPQA